MEGKFIKVKKEDLENLDYEVKVEVSDVQKDHDKWGCEICQENMRDYQLKDK